MHISLYARPFLPGLGGIENTTLHLATAWTKLGHRVAVITEADAPAGYDKAFPFTVVRRPRKADWKRVLAGSDIIVGNGQSVRPLLLWLRSGLPFGYIHQTGARGGLRNGPREAIRGWAGYWAARLASFNICVSQHMVRTSGVPKPVVIVNFAAPVFRPISVEKNNRFLFFGRIIQDKGVDTLIEAVGLCKARGERIEVDIVGDGDWKEQAVELARKLGVAGQIHIKPPQRGEELVRTINAARAVVIPSHWGDPCPLAMAESLACGKCVIASRDGGIPDMATGAALLFEPKDAQGLATLLAAALRDAKLVDDYQAKALARAKDLTLEAVAKKYLAVFQEALANGRGRRGAR